MKIKSNLEKIVKIANILDEMNLHESADTLTRVAAKLAQLGSEPTGMDYYSEIPDMNSLNDLERDPLIQRVVMDYWQGDGSLINDPEVDKDIINKLRAALGNESEYYRDNELLDIFSDWTHGNNPSDENKLSLQELFYKASVQKEENRNSL